MLDRVIHSHIDKLDELEDRVDQDIAKMIDALNIDELIKNPSESLLSFTTALRELIERDYAPEAIDLGLEISTTFEGMKRDIIIQDTDDQDINKDTGLDGDNQD